MESPKQTLLVCGPRVNLTLARQMFPDWWVGRVGEALTGHRFDRIVVLYGQISESKAQDDRDGQWLEEFLPLKLKPDGAMEILG